MYVAVKGGERAIDSAHDLLAEDRRGDPTVPELSTDQIREQLSLAIARLMTEGSLYDPDLAAAALKQARGDLIEAIHILRAVRTTLPRFVYSEPLRTEDGVIERRISAAFKDMPGGQILGPTFDYSHRILRDRQREDADAERVPNDIVESICGRTPRVLHSYLERDALIEKAVPSQHEADLPVEDLTRQSLEFPASREIRLQGLVRGDEGAVLTLGYSTMRGYGDNHGFVGELRYGKVALEIIPPELGFVIRIGEIYVTECETINQHRIGPDGQAEFTRGYGLTFGQCERKAIAMALVDRALRGRELGEEVTAPAQDEEFVLSHIDGPQAAGFVEHIKLPHYGGFQSELAMVRRLREDADARTKLSNAAE